MFKKMLLAAIAAGLVSAATLTLQIAGGRGLIARPAVQGSRQDEMSG